MFMISCFSSCQAFVSIVSNDQKNSHRLGGYEKLCLTKEIPIFLLLKSNYFSWICLAALCFYLLLVIKLMVIREDIVYLILVLKEAFFITCRHTWDFCPSFKEWQRKHHYMTFRMIKFWKITWHIQHDSTEYSSFIKAMDHVSLTYI